MKLNRCKIIKDHEGVIEGRASDTVFAKVTLKNNTHWPYKTGFQLVSLTNKINEDVKMPISEVQAMTEYELTIPIKIRADAIPNENSQNPREKDGYLLMFGMLNRKGMSFGETIHVKVKVLPKVDDTLLFTKAKKIIDNNKEDKITFEEAMFALNECNFDENKALELIKSMRRFKSEKQDKILSSANNDGNDFRD